MNLPNFPIRIFFVLGVLIVFSLGDTRTIGQIAPIPDGALVFPRSSGPPTPVPPVAPQAPIAPVAPQGPSSSDQPTSQNPPDQPKPGQTPAPDTVTNLVQCNDYQLFYDPLYPYGVWIITPYYGYVFQPFVAQGNWAPYEYGHWGHSDEGWAWESDEPWAGLHITMADGN